MSITESERGELVPDLIAEQVRVEERAALIAAQARAEERDRAWRNANPALPSAAAVITGYVEELRADAQTSLPVGGALDGNSICPECNQALKDHVPLGRISVMCPDPE